MIDALKRHRSALHRIPEIGYDEHKTHAYIWRTLSALKPDKLQIMAETGVYCAFKGGLGKSTAFRADMDALPLVENTGRPDASTNGCMHACGHDGHMAALLTLAELIAGMRDRLTGDVILLFQPAEETTGGAKRMIDEGALSGIDAVYGLHMMPGVPAGEIGLRAGCIMARAVEFNIVLTGRSAHGAQPHLGADCVSAAAQIYALIQSIVARRVDPFDACVLTVGRMEAGRVRNAIADRAVMECMLRSVNPGVCDAVFSAVKAAVSGVCAAFGVSGEIIMTTEYPAVINREDDIVWLKELLNDSWVEAKPLLTAEDFAFFLNEKPGAYIFIGCDSAPLHTPEFDFDEVCLIPAVRLFERLLSRT